MDIKKIEAYPMGLNHTVISITVEKPYKDVENIIAEAQSGKHTVEIAEKKQRRSLSQNAYYNELLDKLQSKLMHSMPISRGTLHEHMLSEYGVTRTWEDGRPMVIPLTPDQDAHAMGLHAQALNAGELNGKPCVWWRVVKGSSEMNTKEFTHLLDGLIEECKEQGIDTAPSAPFRRV